MSQPVFSPKAVVFDLDGTLIDSLSLVLEAITHALEPFGSRPTREIFARLGGPPGRFLATLVNDERHVPSAIRRLEEFHHANGHLIRPFEGVKPLLADLRASDVALAVWTGRDRVSTDHLLKVHDLEDYFQAVVCGDDLPTHKPDGAGLAAILSRLRIDAAETLMVGDADVDVLGATACGVKTLLIRDARVVEPQVLDLAWQTAASPGEAYTVVRRLVRMSG